jgi:hypothetical protein
LRSPPRRLRRSRRLTIHAPGRWLVLQLLLQAARLYAASLTLALSLKKPGGLGNAVGRLLLQFALSLYRALFCGCCCRLHALYCDIAPHPELEKAWLFGQRSWPPPASVCPQPPGGMSPPASLLDIPDIPDDRNPICLACGNGKDVSDQFTATGRWKKHCKTCRSAGVKSIPKSKLPGSVVSYWCLLRGLC